MNNSLKIVEWDSEFFGYPIAKIIAESISDEKLAELISEAKASGVKLIYLFTNPADTDSCQSAKAVQAKLVDQKVTFHINIDAADSYATDEHIEEFGQDHPTEKLIDLSIQSGLYSRYKIDSGFKNNEFEKLYVKWIENSVNKKIADHTFMYREGSQELGFVTLKIKENCGEIGLIAVDENSRGRSIGKKLTHAVMHLLSRQHITELEVATQSDNADACNFYTKVGFTIHKTETIYHIWL